MMISAERTKQLRAQFHWLRQFWLRRYVNTIEHEEVVKSVREDGRLTSRFSFMVTMSCAIAVLGLLLSSPAVVIGAMLISPLMSPIVSLGFSLCLLDIKQLKKSLEALVVGIVLALAISWAVVSMSPLTDATPEILARTRPNLFDLLVAIFSGLAGGYAVIKRKGEAIVGVAIATALMPPLAVVGFGLATGSSAITQGAFMLFMTNLLAIALSVTLLTKFYGFGDAHSPKHTAWQVILIAGVFGALSLPLGIALKNIAYQTYITKTAKSTIQEYFGADTSRISMFNIKFISKEEPRIDTVILTPVYRTKATKEITKLLVEKTNAKIALKLDQVVVAHEVIEDAATNTNPVSDNTLVSAMPALTPQQSPAEKMTNELKQALFFPAEYVQVDLKSKVATIRSNPVKDLNLSLIHQFELRLIERYPDWDIRVVPPYQALPNIMYDQGSDAPNAEGNSALVDILWALKRWNAQKVEVVGFASTIGEYNDFNNTSLAYRRTQQIVEIIKEAGVSAVARAEYRGSRQREEERKLGINSFHRVEVRLVKTLEQEEVEESETSAEITDAVLENDSTTEKSAAVTNKELEAAEEPAKVVADKKAEGTPEQKLAEKAVEKLQEELKDVAEEKPVLKASLKPKPAAKP